MILEAGYEGFTMFELGKVGIFVAIAGILYLFAFSSRLLPDVRTDAVKLEEEPEEHGDLHRVEAVLGARFPGINKKLGDFNFKRHYGAEVKEIKRSGQSIVGNLENEYLREGDTLVVMADDSFVKTWGESSVFVLLANGKDTEPVPGKGKRWFALALLILMIVGATVGELPVVKEAFPEIKLDMFFFVSITTIIMAWTKIFPARKYTKYISWDILITIACAFAISKAMVNSGVADAVARFIIGMSHHYGPPRVAGCCVYHNELVYRTDYEQCGRGTRFPVGTFHLFTDGSQSDAFLRCNLYGGFCQLLHSYRVSD